MGKVSRRQVPDRRRYKFTMVSRTFLGGTATKKKWSNEIPDQHIRTGGTLGLPSREYRIREERERAGNTGKER